MHLRMAPKCFVLWCTACARRNRAGENKPTSGRRSLVLSSRDEELHGKKRSFGWISLLQLSLYLPPSLDQSILWVTQTYSETSIMMFIYMIIYMINTVGLKSFKSYPTIRMFVKSHLLLERFSDPNHLPSGYPRLGFSNSKISILDF